MEKDNILVLENGLKCEILAKVTYANQNYFFVEQLNDGDEGMENFAILKELKENNELYVVKEENNEILLEILKILTKDFSNIVSELKIEDLS